MVEISGHLSAPDPSFLRRWAIPRAVVVVVVAYLFWGTRWYDFTALGLACMYAYTRYQYYFGLDQWPNPSGPYYNWWMQSDAQEDYYLWLSRIHGHHRPWVWWAMDEKVLNGETPFPL